MLWARCRENKTFNFRKAKLHRVKGTLRVWMLADSRNNRLSDPLLGPFEGGQEKKKKVYRFRYLPGDSEILINKPSTFLSKKKKKRGKYIPEPAIVHNASNNGPFSHSLESVYWTFSWKKKKEIRTQCRDFYDSTNCWLSIMSLFFRFFYFFFFSSLYHRYILISFRTPKSQRHDFIYNTHIHAEDSFVWERKVQHTIAIIHLIPRNSCARAPFHLGLYHRQRLITIIRLADN